MDISFISFVQVGQRGKLGGRVLEETVVQGMARSLEL
jgi:hypothetical protein